MDVIHSYPGDCESVSVVLPGVLPSSLKVHVNPQQSCMECGSESAKISAGLYVFLSSSKIFVFPRYVGDPAMDLCCGRIYFRVVEVC